MVTIQTGAESTSNVLLDEEIEQLEAQLKLKRGVKSLIVELEEKVTKYGFDSFAQFVETYFPNITQSPARLSVGRAIEPIVDRMRSTVEKRKRIKITTEIIADLRNRRNNGDSAKKISKDLNISYLTVLKYLKLKS